MGSLARDHGDPGLLAFVEQLLADECLEAAAAAVARKLLDAGAERLTGEERVLIEAEVIEPWLGDCEACHATPDWSELLHVYDTGLCASCFDKLEGVDIPAVRPDWMPLPLPAPEDEDTIAGGSPLEPAGA